MALRYVPLFAAFVALAAAWLFLPTPSQSHVGGGIHAASMTLDGVTDAGDGIEPAQCAHEVSGSGGSFCGFAGGACCPACVLAATERPISFPAQSRMFAAALADDVRGVARGRSKEPPRPAL